MNRDEISRLELLQAAHPDGLVFPHLADAYRRAGRYAQAETVLNAGLRRHSDYSSAHVVLGRLRLDQGKHSEAEQAFRRVLELDPENLLAMESLAEVSLEQGRVEDALTQFRRLARLKPSAEVHERVRELEHRLAELRAMPSEIATSSPSGRATASHAERGGGRQPGTSRGNGAPRTTTGGGPFPEPGEVVTETMAELYVRQGLNDHAAAVYRQLLQRNPQDARLRAKLEDAEAAAGGIAVPADEPYSEPVSGESQPRDPSPARPDPPTARAHLRGLLDWSPDRESHSLDALPAWPDPASLNTSRAHRTRQAAPWESPSGSPDSADSGAAPSARDPSAPARFEPRQSEPSPTEPAPFEPAPFEPAPSGSARAEPVRPGPERAASVPSASAPSASAPFEALPFAPLSELESAGADEEGPGQHETMARALIAITDMLVGLLEYRDPFFRGSSSLTRLLADQVADEMGLSSAQKVDLALAALLRDLGRLAMGGRLVSKSGHQSQEGRRKIERHVDLALHLLEGIELPRSVRLAVRHHHERWDGAGYPDGLAGERIPHLARVLAVVDSFGAMVSPRSYRLPRKVPDAAREILDASGTQYDPTVVNALMRVLARRDQARLGFMQRPHILLVTPDQPGGMVTAAKLCTAGFLAEVSTDADAARERLRRVPVAALVVSVEAGADAAAAFIRTLRVDPLFAAMPVVAVDAESVALRVRLLESGADVCFPSGVTYAELQGTLGALVRRTLNAARDGAPGGDAGPQEAPWLALQGDLEDFPLTWVLQVMKYDSRTAAIGIRTSSADGAIYLERGDAVHAQIRGGPKGERALRRMLGWEDGRFTVQPDARPRERTIETSIMHLLLTQAVNEDHAAAGIFGTVSDES